MCGMIAADKQATKRAKPQQRLILLIPCLCHSPFPTTDPPPALTLTTTTPLLTTCPLLGSLPSRIPTGNTCCLWISQKHCKFFVISSVRAFYKVASGNVASIHQPHPISPSSPLLLLSLLAIFMPSTTQQFIVRIFLHHAAEAQTT